MAQIKTLQRRIRSVKNAGQITKALEVVAASRMRRIQDLVQRSRVYAELASSIMQRMAPSQEVKQHPYFQLRDSSRAGLYIVFTSDRGQAGAFNSNIFSLVHKSIIESGSKDRAKILVFGRKGAAHFGRLDGIELIGQYENVPDVPEANYFAPAIETLQKGYDEGLFSYVNIIYTGFISSLSQQVKSFQLLPVDLSQDQAAADSTVYEFEPAIEDVLEEALRLYWQAKIMQSRIESAISEHAMRMVAMGNANRNASDLAESLTLEMNAVRQASITQEIAEITGGAEAIAAS